MVIEFKVDPDKSFDRAVRKATKGVSDLTIPLTDISKRWYKGNKSIFTLKTAGLQYKDLSDKYKKVKMRKVGFVYPILKASGGRIESAITKAEDSNAVNQILNKKILLLGVTKSSDFMYPMAQHYGSPKQGLPARPFLFTGAEQILPEGHKTAKKIYIQILSNYVKQVSKGMAT